MDPPRIILLNQGAGDGARAERRIESALRDARLEIPVRVVSPARLDTAIDRLVRDGASILAVSGGDGSLRSAAERIAGTGRTLLPVPSGTLNNFARRMGITNPERAVASIAEGCPRPVTIGIIDDHVFLNTATFGCYASAVRVRDRWSRRLTRWPAAALGVMLAVARLQRLEFTMLLDGERVKRSAPLVWIGMEGSTAANMRLAGRAAGAVGLEIAIPRVRNRRQAVALLARVFGRLVIRDGPAAEPALEVVRARSAIIDTGGPIDVTVDGEVRRIESPVFVTTRSEGLCILAPCGTGSE